MSLSAQPTICTIHVVVKDSLSGEPLQDVTLLDRNTGKGSKTDSLGRATLRCANGDTLWLRYTGYIPRSIPVSGTGDIQMQIRLQPNEKEMEEVRVTTFRTNSRMEDLATRVEVLGTEDLEEENGIKPGNITSLLGDIAGIQLQTTSVSSGNTLARIQGMPGRYTQLLKDGMPLYGGLSGNFGILQIPPLDLKQIEIIQGASSTLYGGDAIAGIINLVTKEPTTDRELIVTLNRSTLAENNANLYYAKRWGKTGFTFFAGQTLQHAVDVDHDGLSDLPALRSTLLHPKWVWYINARQTLTVNYSLTLDQRKGGQMDWFKTGASDSLFHTVHQSNRQNADLHWVYQLPGNRQISFQCSGSFLDAQMKLREYSYLAKQGLYYSEWSYHQQKGKFDWVGGLNLNGEDFQFASKGLLHPIPSYQQQTLGFFIQDNWKWTSRFSMETGFRLDHISQNTWVPLPRLALLYKPSGRWTLRMHSGLGYKRPQPFAYLDEEKELGGAWNSAVLQKELAWGTHSDLQYHRKWKPKQDLILNQAFFYTALYHPVDQWTDASQVIWLRNFSSPLISAGSQSYARLQYNQWELYTGYVYTRVKRLYDPVHPYPITTPRHHASCTLVYEFGESIRAGLEASYIYGQLNQDYQEVKGYMISALMIQYHWKIFDVVLNGENLGNVRQSRMEPLYDGPVTHPVYRAVWAPVEGRVLNLSVRIKL